MHRSITSPASATVSAGEVTTLDAPIVFGPRITGVDPQGFVTPTYDDTNGEYTGPNTYSITGSGFGASQGLSVLRYAGVNVDAASNSWSDASIEVDVLRLERALHDVVGSRLSYDSTADAFRFEVVTCAGASSSEPVGIVSTWLHAYERHDESVRLGIEAGTFWRYHLPGVTYTIHVDGGAALAGVDGGDIASITTVPVDPYGHGLGTAFVVRLDSGLPALVTVDASGDPLFAAAEPASIAVAGALSFAVDSAVYADGAVTITGSVFGWDGLPMPDDGAFTLRIPSSGYAPFVTDAVTIDADGRFTAVGAVPETLIGQWVDVWLAYLGFEIAADFIEVIE